MEFLKQGTKISFDVQTLKGIKPDQPINNDVYDYTHFVAWRNQNRNKNKNNKNNIS